MARTKSEILVTQSLVDRLTDIEGWPESRAASIAMYRDSLKRDLEWLLNTRKPVMPELEPFPQTSASVLNYGLPDVHSFGGSAGKDEKSLIAALEKCIRTYEPRIVQPRVFMSRTDMLSRSLKFQVGYDWMDQSYSGIGALGRLPNSNREYGSITYQRTRPLGR